MFVHRLTIFYFRRNFRYQKLYKFDMMSSFTIFVMIVAAAVAFPHPERPSLNDIESRGKDMVKEPLFKTILV